MNLEEMTRKFQALEELTGHSVSPGWRRVFAALFADDTDDAGLTPKEAEIVGLSKEPGATPHVKQIAQEIKDAAPGEHPEAGPGPETVEPPRTPAEPSRPPWQEPRRR
jgi:hypothetical protein